MSEKLSIRMVLPASICATGFQNLSAYKTESLKMGMRINLKQKEYEHWSSGRVSHWRRQVSQRQSLQTFNTQDYKTDEEFTARIQNATCAILLYKCAKQRFCFKDLTMEIKSKVHVYIRCVTPLLMRLGHDYTVIRLL